MRLAGFALVLIALCCLISSPAAAQCVKSQKTISLESFKSVPRTFDKHAPGDTCVLFKHDLQDTLIGYSSGYVTSDRTVTYFDPADCGGDVYPFEITGVTLSLHDPSPQSDPRQYKWPVKIDIVVSELYDPADSCLGPGADICRKSIWADSATFAFPSTVTVPFESPCCVEGPVFVGIEYTDPSTEPFPSVIFDAVSELDNCQCFMFYCGYWIGFNAFWVQNPGFPFFEVVGVPQSDTCIDDFDNDGIPDAEDNCVADWNPSQIDRDGDGMGEPCDPDDDNDGVPDGSDNCPLVANTDQTDSDTDGIGDACESCCGIYTAGMTGNIDFDFSGVVDLSDMLMLADAVFLGGAPLICQAAANTDGDAGCVVDLADILWMANAVYLGGPANAACMPDCE